MGFIKARGSSLYYEEAGSGPPILLIPPAGSTASTWGTLVDDLAGAGRVVAYDRRGYARSGGGVVRSAAGHTRDAAALLDALGAGPAVLAGTSAGATIALDLAVRRPDLVRAVVVHEAAWRALRHPDASGLGTLARAIPTATVRQIDGTAHAVAFDAPGNFAQVIVEAMSSSEMVKAAPHREDSVRSGADERCT